jgi:hypothetical protein
MPIRTFKCKYCGRTFEKIYLSRETYEETIIEVCTCNNFADAVGVEIPARRNPEHGLQR